MHVQADFEMQCLQQADSSLILPGNMPSCESAQSDLRAALSANLSKLEYIDVSADGVALRSDCADEQADLELHCQHNYGIHQN